MRGQTYIGGTYDEIVADKGSSHVNMVKKPVHLIMQSLTCQNIITKYIDTFIAIFSIQWGNLRESCINVVQSKNIQFIGNVCVFYNCSRDHEEPIIYDLL